MQTIKLSHRTWKVGLSTSKTFTSELVELEASNGAVYSIGGAKLGSLGPGPILLVLTKSECAALGSALMGIAFEGD